MLENILLALRHIHSLGIAHNDITMNNIALRPDGSPVIINFGNAAPLGMACRAGTPGFTNFSTVSAIDNDIHGFTCVKHYVAGKVQQGA